MAYNYDDPIIHSPRLGTSESPFKDISESLIIDNSGKVELTEYPNQYNRVTVTSETNDWFETNSDIPEYNSYKVDYNRKMVTFNQSNIGKQLQFSYKGMGNSAIPSTSIYTQRDGLSIKETLANIIENGREGINALNDLSEFSFVSQYDNATKYKKWNFVLHNNKTYVAVNDVTGESPESSVNWQLVSSGYAWKGVYDSAKTYTVGDMISDADKHNIYISLMKSNTADVSDTTKWSKIFESNETTRETNEQTRISQEDTRTENELTRKSQEQTRQSQEGTRQQNEQNRILNEQDRITKWQQPVVNFEDIATTYTDPSHGDTVMVTSTSEIYRYDSASSTWDLTQKYTDTAITNNTNDIGNLSTLPTWLQESIANAVEQLNRYSRQFGINVKQPPYNATSGGTIDDTTVIQDALNVAETSESKTVYAPKGTYLISNITIPDGVRFIGDGEWSTTILTNSNINHAVTIVAGSNRTKVTDMQIETTSVFGTDNAGINCEGSAAECTFLNLRIKKFKYGMKATDGFWMNTVENIRWNDCDVSFYGEGTAGTSINNVFMHCYSDRPKTGGYFLQAYKNTEFVNCNFGGLKGFEGTPTYAIYATTNTKAIKMTTCNFEHHIAPVDGMIKTDGNTNIELDSCIFPNNDGIDSANVGYLIHAKGSSWIKVTSCRELGSGVNIKSIKVSNYGRTFTYFNDPFFDAIDNQSNNPSTVLYKERNAGLVWFSGDATTTQFSFPHNLKGEPTSLLLTPRTSVASHRHWVTANATEIIITFADPPYNGVDIIAFWWNAFID